MRATWTDSASSKYGQGEGLRGQLGFQGDSLALPLVVEVTELALAKSWGAAQSAIGFDMGTTSNVNAALTQEQSSEAPHPCANGIKEIRGEGRQNL